MFISSLNLMQPRALSCITVTAARAATTTGTLKHQYPFNIAPKINLRNTNQSNT